MKTKNCDKDIVWELGGGREGEGGGTEGERGGACKHNSVLK